MIRGKNVTKMSHEEWLMARRKGIGGSDAACILGINPWKSAIQLYNDKVGEAPLEGVDSERMRIGRDLEDYVAKRFTEATGKKVRRNNFMLHYDQYPFLFADIDRAVVGENAILECKTTNSFSSKDWADDKIPPYYELQCMHYMLVTGAERCYIACLIGNESFVIRTIERDDIFIQHLLNVELNFWNNHVLAHEVPEADGSKAYSEYLSKRFPRSNEQELILDDDSLVELLEEYDVLNKTSKKLEKDMNRIKQTIQELMGENGIARIGKSKATWMNQSRVSIDKDRLQEEMPEIFEQYKKVSESRVFCLSVKF